MDMEIDIKNTPVILHKVRTNDIYTQNLYAALCNNIFVNDNNEEYGYSWRDAANIVCSIRKSGHYLDWYRSGSSNDSGKVSEGTITQEISNDLSVIGWKALVIHSEYNGSKKTY